jgi:hypothetical protein
MQRPISGMNAALNQNHQPRPSIVHDRSAAQTARSCLLAVLLALIMICPPLALRQGLAAPAAPGAEAGIEEGTALARELCAQKPRENLATRGLLSLRDEAGHRTEIPIKFALVLETNGWRTLYETEPTNGTASIGLLIRHFEHGTNRYYLATNSEPAALDMLGRASNPPSIWQPFAGSDFALGDLGLEFLHWPTQKIVKTDPRRGRRFSVLESQHQPESGGYARVLSWIDPNTGGMLRAEAYNSDGQQVKEFRVRSVKRGQLKELEIRNFLTHSITRLEFDLESDVLPEDGP